MSGRGTPAIVSLRRSGIGFTVHEYEVEGAVGQGGRAHGRRSSYAVDAAAALRVDPGQVFKTLIAAVDDALVAAIVPATADLDLKQLADAVGGRRAVMAEPALAERATGYVVGGISPFGQRRRLTMVVDVSALDWATVFVSGGRRGLQVEVAPTDLVTLTGAIVRAIGRAER